MRIFLLFACAVLTADPALAGCPAGTTPILTCTFNNGVRAVDACEDGTTVIYAFCRVARAPDLTRVTPVADLGHTRWPGIGRSFQAAGAPDPFAAGIFVLRGDGEERARLECDPGSIATKMDALSEAKEALGLCRDGETWGGCE